MGGTIGSGSGTPATERIDAGGQSPRGEAGHGGWVLEFAVEGAGTHKVAIEGAGTWDEHARAICTTLGFVGTSGYYYPPQMIREVRLISGQYATSLPSAHRP